MLPEIFGLIHCIVGLNGCVIVSNTRRRLYGTENGFLHPVVAPIRDQKTRQNAPKIIILET